jgi:hypothetical protein
MYQYLHEVSPGIFYLDHRLTPEVRGMLAAMSSRAPKGGVKARYAQIVEAVAEGLYSDRMSGEDSTWEALCKSARDHESPFVVEYVATYRLKAEERLCTYPLHPKVKAFFDDFVGKYGHSSILELVGGVPVFTEGISWLTAWLLFDSPLCSGQEFSTRAVQHKDWPIAREAGLDEIQALHDAWFDVFLAEVAWWKDHFSVEANRKALGIGDKEPFRPALDRARWALPGTISTGCAHTGHIRERARAIRDGSLLAQQSGATVEVWADIREAYLKALPGLEGMGLREAVYGQGQPLTGHLSSILDPAQEGADVQVSLMAAEGLMDTPVSARGKVKTYLDPALNTHFRVNVEIRCSLAVARDWHRHRTMYPWQLYVVTVEDQIVLDHHYEPKSDFGKAHTPDLLRRSSALYQRLMTEGNRVQAALALPFGTRVLLCAQGGLRDVVYVMELRRDAHGANFEYREQATTAMDMLREELAAVHLSEGMTLADFLGV